MPQNKPKCVDDAGNDVILCLVAFARQIGECGPTFGLD